MSANPILIPIQGVDQALPSAVPETCALPAELPPGLPAFGVFDSLFSGLPFGAFIGRYWWVLLLIFYLFIKPGFGSGASRAPLGGGFLWILILLFALSPQFFSKLGIRR